MKNFIIVDIRNKWTLITRWKGEKKVLLLLLLFLMYHAFACFLVLHKLLSRCGMAFLFDLNSLHVFIRSQYKYNFQNMQVPTICSQGTLLCFLYFTKHFLIFTQCPCQLTDCYLIVICFMRICNVYAIHSHISNV